MLRTSWRRVNTLYFLLCVIQYLFMKNYLKYIGGFVLLVAIGGGALWAIQQYRYRKSPEYQAIKYYNDLADQYAKDTYGGDTPEETLRLFIDALKKGDVELASKYFVIEKRNEVLSNLQNTKDKIDTIIKQIEIAKLSKIEEDKAYFVIIANGVVKTQIILNKILKKWKIENL